MSRMVTGSTDYAGTPVKGNAVFQDYGILHAQAKAAAGMRSVTGEAFDGSKMIPDRRLGCYKFDKPLMCMTSFA